MLWRKYSGGKRLVCHFRQATLEGQGWGAGLSLGNCSYSRVLQTVEISCDLCSVTAEKWFRVAVAGLPDPVQFALA